MVGNKERKRGLIVEFNLKWSNIIDVRYLKKYGVFSRFRFIVGF